MTTHRQIQLMLRRPKALLDFKTTGRLPTINVPAGPLIILIESIHAPPGAASPAS